MNSNCNVGKCIALPLMAVVLLLTGCASTPKQFEKERRGYRHLASRALYPRNVGNYSFLNHDETQALASPTKFQSTALYLDYKSGGPMTSILYRPFAKIETYRLPKKTTFEGFVAKELQRLSEGSKILQDVSGKNKSGARFHQIKIRSDQAFLSEGFSGVGFHEKLPAITKLIYLDRGEFVLFMTTSYPQNEEETLSKPNGEFVAKFIEAQN